MKVLPFRIPKPGEEALVYQEDRETQFFDQLHQHEEIQISLILAGSGTIIIGDSINNFEESDILVIGSNVPHVFKSDLNGPAESVMYTLFFTRDSFGKDFFEVNDLVELKDFFKDSVNGFKVVSLKNQIIELFQKLKELNRIERIAYLLKILNLIRQAEKHKLSSFVYRKKYTDAEGKRMNDVFQYAMTNYSESISLEEVAHRASMSKNAFCRYFKKRTNKTYFQFLIEIRIENAGKMLFSDKEMPIAMISELCGFQNISNFNRKFKEIKGVTPKAYRSMIASEYEGAQA